jgi:CheY-like chemotaxis protein
MMTQLAESRVAFIDDDPEFLVLVEDKALQRGLSVRTTHDVAEGLAWAEQGDIDKLVVDLRMPEDGLTVLEDAQSKGDIDVKLWTVFEPTEEEERRASQLGVKIVNKRQLVDLLDGLGLAVDTPEPGEVRKLRNRVRTLERVHQEWVDDLVSKLAEIPDLDKAVISSAKGPFTVAELIDDIRNLRPRGIEYIRLWRRAMGTILGLRRKP